MPGYLDGWAIDVENGFGLVERAKIVLAFGLPVLTVGIVLSALWAAGAAVVAMVLGRWRRWRVANGADRLKSVWSIVGRRPTGAGLGRAGAVAVRSGCSASVCYSRYQGPMNHWPPSIGQPSCSQR